ncbi:MAG: TetR/AcrR family transcriptional regulator [Cyclobacteriaceae bacterium]|nr:TetR/AcrR family transcriptional regulator [Cyclobacteriaceae bacterium]
MPSERFHQLKPVKKKTFLRYAYQEFAMHSYEGASVSKLVATMKMAKGSIYQYFQDKEDLYLFLINHAREQLQLLLEQACPLPTKNISFQNWYRNSLVVQLKLFTSLPSYGLILLRNKADQTGILHIRADNPQSTYLMRAANRAGEQLSSQQIYRLTVLPLTVFEFTLSQHVSSVNDLITHNKSIELSSAELLNICDGFL